MLPPQKYSLPPRKSSPARQVTDALAGFVPLQYFVLVRNMVYSTPSVSLAATFPPCLLTRVTDHSGKKNELGSRNALQHASTRPGHLKPSS